MSPSTGRIPSNARRSNARRSPANAVKEGTACFPGSGSAPHAGARGFSAHARTAADRERDTMSAKALHAMRNGLFRPSRKTYPQVVLTHCLKRQPKTSHGGGWRTQLPSAGCKRMPARVPDAESGRMKNGTRERVPNRTYVRGALESQSERELGPGRVLHHVSRLGRVDVSAAARCRADGNVAAVPEHVARLGGRNGAGPRR